MRAHKRIADETYGLLGRSMDHVASFVTGMSLMPEVFEAGGQGFGRNMVDYYRHMRANDVYAAGDKGTMLHFNGRGWRRIATDTLRPISAGVGFASNDVFAVTGVIKKHSRSSVLFYDGVVWHPLFTGNSIVDIWDGSWSHDLLLDIWGSSSSDLLKRVTRPSESSARIA